MTTTVSVCLCTFRRASLTATLAGLAHQVLPPQVEVEVVVVDSDLSGSARHLVEQAQSQLPLTIRYVIADLPGVAMARNKSVAMANGEWLAFIDDDEVPSPEWLQELLQCAQRWQAQVVFGAVQPVYPADCPEWIRASDLFGRHLPSSGTRVTQGATGNALMARATLAGETRIFDPAYGTTGGEDTEFFCRLSRKGVVMVTCREAVVGETVEAHRLNRGFLLRKAIRVGETYFRIFYAKAPRHRRAKLLARASVQCLAAMAVAILIRPFGLGRSMVFQIKAAANLGKLRAAFGQASVELYKN